MPSNPAGPDASNRPKRHLGAQTVSGIRRSTGRARVRRPGHYMTKAEAKEFALALEAARRADASGPSTHKPYRRAGMRSLDFRRRPAE